jgi:hypothetical protein
VTALHLEGFTASDDGRFRCLSRTLPDNTYVCITDTGGMDYPTQSDFMVCIYSSAEAFGDDPSSSLLSTMHSDASVCLDDAVWIAIRRSTESI